MDSTVRRSPAAGVVPPDADPQRAYFELQIFSRNCLPESVRAALAHDDRDGQLDVPAASEGDASAARPEAPVISAEVAALGLEVLYRTDPAEPYRRAEPHGPQTDGAAQAVPRDARVTSVDLSIAAGTGTSHITVSGPVKPLGITLTPRRKRLPPSVVVTSGQVRIRGLRTVPPPEGGAPSADESLGFTRTALILTGDAAGVEVHPGRFSGQGFEALGAAELEELYLEWLSATPPPGGSLGGLDLAYRPEPHLFLSLGLTLSAGGSESGPPTFEPSWVEAGPAEPFVFDNTYAINTALLHYELRRRGIGTTRLSQIFLTDDRAEQFVSHVTSTNRTATPAVRATGRKSITARRLAAVGIEVAHGRVFDDKTQRAEAWALAQQFRRSVVKPSIGSKGRGVTVGISTREGFDAAWDLAFGLTRGEVLVEEHFEGTEARFLLVDGRCVAVSMRRPPRVTGDGEHTIQELIQRSNAARRRSPHLYNRLIALDSGRVQRMRMAGVRLSTVLPPGQTYTIDDKGGFSTGADSVDITDEVHPSFLDIASRAVTTFVGLDVAGVDILAHDLEQEAVAGNYIVVEINSQPGIGAHHFPVDGKARNVAGAIIDATIAPRANAPLAPASSETPEPPAQESPDAQLRDVDASLLAAELTKRGFSVSWWSPEYFDAYRGQYRMSVWGSYTNKTGQAALLALGRPAIAHRLLKQAGTPLAKSRVFSGPEQEQAWDYAKKKSHVVVRSGLGVGVDVAPVDQKGFSRAWSAARRTGKHGVLVQNRPPGDEWWFLVAHGVVLHAIHRVDDDSFGHRLSEFHPSYLACAGTAAEAFLGLDICEVAVVIRDRKRPAEPGNHVVRQVRPGPSLASYSSPAHGEHSEAVRDIIDLHLGTFRPHAGSFVASQWRPRLPRVRRYLRRLRRRLGGFRRRVKRVIGSPAKD